MILKNWKQNCNNAHLEIKGKKYHLFIFNFSGLKCNEKNPNEPIHYTKFAGRYSIKFEPELPGHDHQILFGGTKNCSSIEEAEQELLKELKNKIDRSRNILNSVSRILKLE